MAALIDLPNEIILRIISSLQSNRDVAALSIQCRSLYYLCDMATRKKYRRIRIQQTDKSLDRAFTILMDILKQPRLGHYVRHIEYWKMPPEHSNYVERECQRKLPENDMRLLRAATRKAGFVYSDGDAVINMLLQQSIEGESDASSDRSLDLHRTFIMQAVTALLISVSPYLESMAMTPTFENIYGFYGDEWDEWDEDMEDVEPGRFNFPLDDLLRRTNADPSDKPYLQDLRRVYLINKPAYSAINNILYHAIDFFGCLARIDHLPSIERVSIDLLEPDKDGLAGLEKESSNFSSISINHSHVNDIYVYSVLRPFKTLREFQCSIGGRCRTLQRGPESPAFDSQTPIETIARHKDTLGILDLDIESQIPPLNPKFDRHAGLYRQRIMYPLDGTPWWQFNGNRHLKDFSVLKRLSLGVNLFIYLATGVIETDSNEKVDLMDCLPDGLEYLCIRGYRKVENPKHDAQLDRLMAVKESGASNLKEIDGIEKFIPNAEHVRDPRDPGNRDLLWEPEEEEWSEEE